MLRQLTAGLLWLIAAIGMCQSDLLGPNQYPQFRTLSGLPGGGYGVRPDGTPAFDGAMAFSTPIGYSLSNWHLAATAANTSDSDFFRLPNFNRHAATVDSLGKFSSSVGASLGRFGSLTGSFMLVSSLGDSAFNAEYQAPLFYKGIGVGVGVQDVSGSRRDRAVGLPGALKSRSLFAVVTAPLPYGIYASVGTGDRRFGRGFANMSAPICPRLKGVLEFDGYNFNEAVAFDPRAFGSLKLFGRGASATMMAGFVRSKYAFWSLNLSM